MKKWLILLLAGILWNSSAIVRAAPAPSGYSQFLASLDSILAGATLPVVDGPLIPARQTVQLGGQAAAVLAAAGDMLGQPVVWGGASPAQGFDCSGLVQYVYRQAGIELPRTADLQFLVGRPVPPSQLQPGDLVYFTTYEPGASHVGIYIGGNQFIHTAFSKGIVAVANLNDSYFVQRYYGAKRVL